MIAPDDDAVREQFAALGFTPDEARVALIAACEVLTAPLPPPFVLTHAEHAAFRWVLMMIRDTLSDGPSGDPGVAELMQDEIDRWLRVSDLITAPAANTPQ